MNVFSIVRHDTRLNSIQTSTLNSILIVIIIINAYHRYPCTAIITFVTSLFCAFSLLLCVIPSHVCMEHICTNICGNCKCCNKKKARELSLITNATFSSSRRINWLHSSQPLLHFMCPVTNQPKKIYFFSLFLMELFIASIHQPKKGKLFNFFYWFMIVYFSSYFT